MLNEIPVVLQCLRIKKKGIEVQVKQETLSLKKNEGRIKASRERGGGGGGEKEKKKKDYGSEQQRGVRLAKAYRRSNTTVMQQLTVKCVTALL